LIAASDLLRQLFRRTSKQTGFDLENAIGQKLHLVK